MEKRIELEKRARKASQITELNLDNCRSTSIVGLSDEYTALETLSLINVGLTTLKGFPKLPNLKKLELSDNRISNGLNYLTTSPKLQSLNLSGNKIKDLETLKPLEEFKNLTVLDLFNNEATLVENYREKIFAMIPSLKFLDGFDCNDDEAPSEGDDDDEVNGNDSDDEDKRRAFCLNGLEIDLDELEEFEKLVTAKRKQQCETTTLEESTNKMLDKELDDLDEYLKELKLKEAKTDNQITTKTTATTSPTLTVTNEANYCSSTPTKNTTTTTIATTATENTTEITNNDKYSFALFLYWFLAILNLASATYFSDGIGEEEDDADDDEEDRCSTDDVSLSEVYNDDLEEDNSDNEWDEDDAAVEDDDVESDDDEADTTADGNASVNKSAKKAENENAEDADAAEEESQARGKKRKHD